MINSTKSLSFTIHTISEQLTLVERIIKKVKRKFLRHITYNIKYYPISRIVMRREAMLQITTMK